MFLYSKYQSSETSLISPVHPFFCSNLPSIFTMSFRAAPSLSFFNPCLIDSSSKDVAIPLSLLPLSSHNAFHAPLGPLQPSSSTAFHTHTYKTCRGSAHGGNSLHRHLCESFQRQELLSLMYILHSSICSAPPDSGHKEPGQPPAQLPS